MVIKMKDIKKSIIVFGAVAIALLIVSSVTAVGQVYSEPVMKNIESEKQKEIIANQLETMWNQLLEEESLVAEFQENSAIDPFQDFEDLFDMEGFVSYITSDDFIDLLNNNYNDIVSNDGFQYLYNTVYVQEYLQSDEFIAFMNTDEVQYIIDNLNIGSGSPQGTYVTETSGSNLNSQVVSTGVRQQISGEVVREPLTNGLIYNNNVNEELQGSATPLGNVQPTINPFLVWIIILFGVITWIPAIIVMILLSPVFFIMTLANFLLWALQGGVWMPGMVFFYAIISLLFTIGYVAIACIGWPVLWPVLLGFLIW